MYKRQVAIDSPAAAGAGTQAKLIAKHYNLLYCDTGKIYRLLAKSLMQKKPKNNFLYSGNSGTLARMLIALLATQDNFKTKISGDNSLNKRDMKRIIDPLSKIGCNFYPKSKTTLPLTIEGTNMPLAQKFEEKIGSAQIKSSILFASLNIFFNDYALTVFRYICS